MTEHNRRTGVRPVEFSLGDLVLLLTAAPRRHKLQFKWRGIHQVIRVVSALVFEVESLVSGEKQTVHARRLPFYCEADLDSVADSDLLKVSEHFEANYQDFKQFLDVRLRGDDVELQIEWSGLLGKIDTTWEPLKLAYEDLPLQVEDYLRTAGNRRVKSDALRLCGLPV